MRVRRGLLFWGLLLIPLGAIPLAVSAGGLDPARLLNAWQLWPLIVIGIGLLILGSRTPLSLVGLVVVALTIGTIGGSAIANGTSWFGAIGCGFGNDTTASVDKTGSFETTADVRLDLNCGTLDLSPSDGQGWTVHAAYRGDPPSIDGRSDALNVTSPDGGDRFQKWTIGVPPSQLRSLQITANAATTTADVGAAHLDELRADLNAGDARFRAGEASVQSLDLTMNAGR